MMIEPAQDTGTRRRLISRMTNPAVLLVDEFRRFTAYESAADRTASPTGVGVQSVTPASRKIHRCVCHHRSQARRAENAMKLGMVEQGELQPKVELPGVEDFDMDQCFWEVRDIGVLGDAGIGWTDGPPRSSPKSSCLTRFAVSPTDGASLTWFSQVRHSHELGLFCPLS